jgi:hypothetical protein
MSLFSCNSCSDLIVCHKPRIHCSVCFCHDICANCYVLSICTGSHTQDHATSLVIQSGYVPKPPPMPPRRPTLPARHTDTMPVLPAPSPESNSQIQRKPVEVAKQAPVSRVMVTGAEPVETIEQVWKPLFDGCNPSPTAVAFFNALFDCLDTTKSGLLTPEQYSAFCDAQGYLPDEDVCERPTRVT